MNTLILPGISYPIRDAAAICAQRRDSLYARTEVRLMVIGVGGSPIEVAFKPETAIQVGAHLIAAAAVAVGRLDGARVQPIHEAAAEAVLLQVQAEYHTRWSLHRA